MNRPLAIAAGTFALIIGLLLRGAVGKQDTSDWNGVVRAFLEAFPLVLIVGGILVLLAICIVVLRGRDDEGTTGPRAPGSPADSEQRDLERVDRP